MALKTRNHIQAAGYKIPKNRNMVVCLTMVTRLEAKQCIMTTQMGVCPLYLAFHSGCLLYQGINFLCQLFLYLYATNLLITAIEFSKTEKLKVLKQGRLHIPADIFVDNP